MHTLPHRNAKFFAGSNLLPALPRWHNYPHYGRFLRGAMLFLRVGLVQWPRLMLRFHRSIGLACASVFLRSHLGW